MDSLRVPKANFFRLAVLLSFLLPAQSAHAEKFSIVVLPDTQFYSRDFPAIFDRQTQWVVDNEVDGGMPTDPHPIIYVAHMGDIVDGTPANPAGCYGDAASWGNADGSMDTLDASNIKYGVLPGNHDFDPDLTGSAGTCSGILNQYNDIANFGPSRFPVPGPASWYGGSQDGEVTNNNNYTLFESEGGVEFIAINLAYSAQNGATETTMLNWADARLKAFPNRIGIVTSHFILTDERNSAPGSGGCRDSDDFGFYGNAMWNSLKDNPNLSLMLSGHCFGEKWVIYEGGSSERPGCLGTVHVLMANYQSVNGLTNSGYMRVMRFDTATREIAIDTITEEGSWPASSAITLPSQMGQNTASSFTVEYDTPVSSCADVSLVMDRSGSMNGASAAISGTKLDALQNAADLFVDQISFDERHRLAMVQFNSAVVPFSVPEIPFVDLDDTNVGDAHAMITSIQAGGSTDILDGLQGGVDKLDVSSPVVPYERRVVVLFTDGKHNSPSILSDADLETQLNNRINSVDTDMELYSMGFGTNISDVALSNAAQSNGGWHVNEVDPMGVAKDFSLAAARVMEDQVLSDPIYVIKPGAREFHRFGVSRADRNLTVVTHWDRFDPNRIQIRIEPPGGADCLIDKGSTGSGVKQAVGKNYRLVRVQLPYRCNGTPVHEGEWVVHMIASDDPRQVERVDVLAYAASDIELSARVGLAKNEVEIAAFLDGADLKDAQFTAFLLPPLPEKEDSTRLDELGSDPDSAASIPPLEVIARKADTVPLKITRQKDNSIEAIGRFSPKAKGLYQVRVVAEITDGLGQMLTREATASVYNPRSFGWGFWKWALAGLIALVVVGWLVLRRARVAARSGRG